LLCSERDKGRRNEDGDWGDKFDHFEVDGIGLQEIERGMEFD
jgi:hypothetical protein